MFVKARFKNWITEDYDVTFEEYYTTNVKYEYSNAWAKGGIKHAIVPILGAFIAALFRNDGQLSTLLAGLGIFTLAFVFYGIASYVENAEEFSHIFYGLIVAAGMLTIGKLATWQIGVFAFISVIAYIYISFVHPIWHLIHFWKFRKRDIDAESGKYDQEEAQYTQWKNGYTQWRAGLPSADGPKEDPVVAEARKLFEGYTDTPQRLKARYRQLAKQYHPDKLGEGADDSMFKAVRYVYEELQAKVGKA